MAKKKRELFLEIHNEKEFDNVIRNNTDRLICAEIYSYAFGWCTALDRLFNTMKMDWSDGKLILLKVPTLILLLTLSLVMPVGEPMTVKADESLSGPRESASMHETQLDGTTTLLDLMRKTENQVLRYKFGEAYVQQWNMMLDYEAELISLMLMRAYFHREDPGLPVPADEIEVLRRFRDHSDPVYMFILNTKVTKVFRGVYTVEFAEVTKKELYYYKQEQEGLGSDRPVYELDEPTPDEMEWMSLRELEKQQETTSLIARRSARQAVRKRHRAVLMVPYLTDINFVLFWPHCFHAHPELYEQWDANDIVMIGREEVELSEEKINDIFYAGDAPLNEASLHKLMSGPALAICFRLLNADADNFVSLVRRILYEEIPPYDETKSITELIPLKTAFDRYKTFSPTREEVWQQRKEERELKRENEKRRRARYLSETRRLAHQALEEELEAKRQEREQRKLDFLKAGNLAALEQMKEEPEDEAPLIVVREVAPDSSEEEEECMVEEDEDEYFPPPGLLIPGFYAPPNDIAKCNGLAVLFPKLVQERVTPQPEFLPRHVLVLLEISKRYKAIDAITPYKHAIIHMGVFKASSPYKCVHIAYTVKQFDTLDNSSLNLDQLKLAFMLSVEVDVPLLHLMDLNPVHVSRDCSIGEEECAAMFPVDYGDEIDQFEDFE